MKLPIRQHVRRFQGDAVDLGRWVKPQRTHVTEDGEIIIEKIPSMPSCRMLKPAGHIAWVPLSTGMGRFNPSDPYYLQLSQEKLRKGFLPVAVCPKSMGLHQWLPKDCRDGEPCREAHDKGRISDYNPCSCIVATQKMRSTKQAKVTDETINRHRSKESREAEQREEQNRQVGTAINRMVDILEAKGIARRKP